MLVALIAWLTGRPERRLLPTSAGVQVATTTITVTAATCAAVDQPLSFLVAGAITVADCTIGTTRIDWFRVAAGTTANVVKLDATVTGFTGTGVFVANERARLVWRTAKHGQHGGERLLPAAHRRPVVPWRDIHVGWLGDVHLWFSAAG